MIVAETARLFVRQLVERDIAAVAGLWCDPRVTQFMGAPRHHATVCEALHQELAEQPPARFNLWPVVEKASGAVIGDCGLLDKEIDGQPKSS